MAIAINVPAVSAEMQRGETAITCTNPVSGASWQIRIDYDRSTVDSNPARISQGHSKNAPRDEGNDLSAVFTVIFSCLWDGDALGADKIHDQVPDGSECASS